jgi:CheY-like chemotaxis protein
MSAPKPKLLIVDDENSLRASLSAILSRAGYDIRTAEDGFSALEEVRRDCPHVILSDLNMPAMSGFELLSVIRRRFPAVRVVAMSGAFNGEEVPQGVAADAYYPKGTNLSVLLDTLWHLTAPESTEPSRRVDPSTPVWISLNSERFEEVSSITLSCPDCMRTFSLLLDVSAQLIRSANCVHCSAQVDYAIVESLLPPPMVAVRQRSGAAAM